MQGGHSFNKAEGFVFLLFVSQGMICKGKGLLLVSQDAWQVGLNMALFWFPLFESGAAKIFSSCFAQGQMFLRAEWCILGR
jgi:hypothetical protein